LSSKRVCKKFNSIIKSCMSSRLKLSALYQNVTITDAIMNHIGKSTDLEYLGFDNCRSGNSGVCEFKALLKNVRELEIKNFDFIKQSNGKLVTTTPNMRITEPSFSMRKFKYSATFTEHFIFYVYNCSKLEIFEVNCLAEKSRVTFHYSSASCIRIIKCNVLLEFMSLNSPHVNTTWMSQLQKVELGEWKLHGDFPWKRIWVYNYDESCRCYYGYYEYCDNNDEYQFSYTDMYTEKCQVIELDLSPCPNLEKFILLSYKVEIITDPKNPQKSIQASINEFPAYINVKGIIGKNKPVVIYIMSGDNSKVIKTHNYGQ